MAKKPNWKQRLEAAPISLPGGKVLVTLDDARHYLTAQKIPPGEAEQQILATAIKAVSGAAHGTDFIMHARTAVSRWVHRDVPPNEQPTEPRRKRARKYKVIR